MAALNRWVGIPKEGFFVRPWTRYSKRRRIVQCALPAYRSWPRQWFHPTGTTPSSQTRWGTLRCRWGRSLLAAWVLWAYLHKVSIRPELRLLVAGGSRWGFAEFGVRLAAVACAWLPVVRESVSPCALNRSTFFGRAPTFKGRLSQCSQLLRGFQFWKLPFLDFWVLF